MKKLFVLILLLTAGCVVVQEDQNLDEGSNHLDDGRNYTPLVFGLDFPDVWKGMNTWPFKNIYFGEIDFGAIGSLDAHWDGATLFPDKDFWDFTSYGSLYRATLTFNVHPKTCYSYEVQTETDLQVFKTKASQHVCNTTAATITYSEEVYLDLFGRTSCYNGHCTNLQHNFLVKISQDGFIQVPYEFSIHLHQ